MPSYNSLSTQTTALQTAISTLLAGTTNSQDLVYASTALNTLGTMYGTNDIIGATAANVSAAQTSINAAASSASASVTNSALNLATNFLFMGV